MFTTNLGVEIAGRDLRIAVVQSQFGKIRIRQCLSVDGFLDQSSEDQKTTLLNLVKEHRLSFNRVFLSLPRDRGMLRQIEFPVEVADRLKSAVALQIESLCPWPLNEIYWDFSTEAVKKGAKTLRVTITILPRLELDPWIELFKVIGLPLSGALISAVVQAHGVSLLWPQSGNTIVLDCEAVYTEGVLVQGSVLSSVSQAADGSASAIKSLVEKLLAAGRPSDLESTRVISFGPAAAAADSGGPVALPLENAAADSSLRFGAIATALSGTRKTAFDMNLIPAGQRHRRSPWETVPTFVLLVLAVVLGLGMALRTPYQMTVYASQIDAEISRISPVAREVAKQQTELTKLSERYRALSTNLQNRDYNLEVLQELTRLLPSGSWLVSYSYQDGNLQLSGYADNAAEIQKILATSPLFSGVQPAAGVTRDSKGKEKFTLKAAIEVPK